MEQVDARREPPQRLVWKRLVSRLSAEGLVVLAVAIWWLLSLELPEIIIPKPTAVAQQIWLLFIDITYASHVAASTVRVILGVIIAVALGSLLALIPHWIPIMDVIIPCVGWRWIPSMEFLRKERIFHCIRGQNNRLGLHREHCPIY